MGILLGMAVAPDTQTTSDTWVSVADVSIGANATVDLDLWMVARQNATGLSGRWSFSGMVERTAAADARLLGSGIRATDDGGSTGFGVRVSVGAATISVELRGGTGGSPVSWILGGTILELVP